MISPITSIFGFIGALSLGIPVWAWFAGALCVGGEAVLWFGLFMCIAMDAPFSWYVIGFVCAMADFIITAAASES